MAWEKSKVAESVDRDRVVVMLGREGPEHVSGLERHTYSPACRVCTVEGDEEAMHSLIAMRTDSLPKMSQPETSEKEMVEGYSGL